MKVKTVFYNGEYFVDYQVDETTWKNDSVHKTERSALERKAELIQEQAQQRIDVLEAKNRWILDYAVELSMTVPKGYVMIPLSLAQEAASDSDKRSAARRRTIANKFKRALAQEQNDDDM